MDENSFCKLLEKLQCQFLSCYPNIQWQDIPKDLSWDQQQQLIAHTSASPLNQSHPVKLNYQLNFLKRLLARLEQNCDEVHDDVYESYCQLQQRLAPDATERYAYKHYRLAAPHSTSFTLRESKSFVAEGTTGLCSWQAALALADYLLHNAAIVCDKAVLELGAGTGLCGLIASRCCGVRQMLLTDGSAECVALMREHIRSNFPNAHESAEGIFKVGGTQLLSAAQLPWDTIEEATLADMIEPDVLLAADVVYDDSVFADLTHAIDFVFTLRQNHVQMILAATVRNEHTLSKFLSLLTSLHFKVEERDVIPFEKSYLFWDRSTPVKILSITRNKNMVYK